MFHAFGNNPIKYTDPDGRFDGIPIKVNVPRGFNVEIPMTRNDLKGFYVDIEAEFNKNKNMLFGINVGALKEKLSSCNTFVSAITSFDTISNFLKENAPLINKGIGVVNKFSGIKDLGELLFPDTVSKTRDNFHKFYTQIEEAEYTGKAISNIKLIVNRNTERKRGLAVGGVPCVVFTTTTSSFLYAETSDKNIIKEELKTEKSCQSFFWAQ